MFDVQRESSAASPATAISSGRQRERVIEDCMSGEAGRMNDKEVRRREIRNRLRAQLRSEDERMRQAGRYCYEGVWLTRDEIMARIRARRRREWARLLEMVFLLMGLCGAAFVLYNLLFLFA